jgi:hypothetical protein
MWQLSQVMKMDGLRVFLHFGKEKSGKLKVTKKEMKNA